MVEMMFIMEIQINKLVSLIIDRKEEKFQSDNNYMISSNNIYGLIEIFLVKIKMSLKNFRSKKMKIKDLVDVIVIVVKVYRFFLFRLFKIYCKIFVS